MTELSLPHLVRQPEIASENPPLLLMLHGYGSNEEDLFSFADWLPGSLLIVSLRAPFQLPPYGFAWYSINWDAADGKLSDIRQVAGSRNLVAKIIDEIIEKYKVDKSRICLMGFSQGAILSLATALTYPQKVRYVVALSGYLNPELIPQKMAVSEVSKLQVYISHGFSDPVIPVDWARRTQPFLDSLNIANEYHEYPDGHTVSRDNFESLLIWLKARFD
ncbi:MAG: alpha/beta fold hydrolase [Flavobacteriaceae bacterium]|nr:alpha/beta fold hydrolase [Flavobacteriaceae bacterium]MDZ4148935.1 alpha/beta fold hydrolase [Flavobacteriaceae bacterium]